MLTFKQIEAAFWVSRLRTFAAAAEKLNTTQSAISKRITELEEFLGTPLFDRSRRAVRMTVKGEEFLQIGEEILQMRDLMLERMGRGFSGVRRFRLGVTELTALTWLPRLVQAVRADHPTVSLEPEIDLSMNLCDKLSSGDIDLTIVPSVFRDPRFVAVPLQRLVLAWMCSPELCSGRRVLSLQEIAAHPILVQTERSGVDAVYEHWFHQRGMKIRRLFAGNSLIALSALTMSGFGISYLPALYFDDLVREGLLLALESEEPLPEVPYFAVYRNDSGTAFSRYVAQLCEQFCDFSRPSIAAPGVRPKRTA